MTGRSLGGKIGFMRTRDLFSFAFFFACCILAGASGQYQGILRRNIFTSPEPPPPPPANAAAKISILKPKPVVPLNTLIDLKGIVFFKEGGSYAVINVKNKNEDFVFKQGDMFGEAELKEIREDKILFYYDGKNVVLGLERVDAGGFVEVAPGMRARIEGGQAGPGVPGGAAGADSIPGRVTQGNENLLQERETEPVDVNLENALGEAMKDPNLVRNLNLSPNVRDGKTEGFRLGNIPPESVIYRYGFRNGDVIRMVNGVVIDSLARGFAVYNQISSQKTGIVTVEVLRNNSPEVFTFRLQ